MSNKISRGFRAYKKGALKVIGKNDAFAAYQKR